METIIIKKSKKIRSPAQMEVFNKMVENLKLKNEMKKQLKNTIKEDKIKLKQKIKEDKIKIKDKKPKKIKTNT